MFESCFQKCGLWKFTNFAQNVSIVNVYSSDHTSLAVHKITLLDFMRLHLHLHIFIRSLAIRKHLFGESCEKFPCIFLLLRAFFYVIHAYQIDDQRVVEIDRYMAICPLSVSASAAAQGICIVAAHGGCCLHSGWLCRFAAFASHHSLHNHAARDLASFLKETARQFRRP